MLNVFFYAINVGIIITVLIAKIGKCWSRSQYGYCDKDVGLVDMLPIFLLTTVWAVILLYGFCIEQTILGIVRWLWPVLIVDAIVLICNDIIDEEYAGGAVILAAISVLFCISTFFTPKQTIIDNWEGETETISYGFLTDEIVTKLNLKGKGYWIDFPEMRKIADKDVAIYQIHDNFTFFETEYIPGYLIQEGDEFPELISKRIYFDTSYRGKRDVLRRIRKEYPTLILGDHKFDIDDDGNPYEVYAYREKFYTTNGEDYGLVTIDLKNGNCQRYKANELPNWIDFQSTEPK